MLGLLGSLSSLSTPTTAFVANLPPQWDFPTDVFSVKGELRIDLNKAFFDPDFDSLAFSVDAGPGVLAVVEGDELVVKVGTQGELTVTASDGKARVSKQLFVHRA